MSFTINEIFRHYAAEYLNKHGRDIPVSHLKAIRDIINCRTPIMGGTTYFCEECNTYHYSYHSCKNRNCSQCQNENNQEWIKKQVKKLLPVKYYLLTFTLPAELRTITRSNQKLIYSILFKTAAASFQKLAKDPKYIGGQTGMLAVLHTWSRTLYYHPHIHFIVPCGGYDIERDEWIKANHKFLVPVRALSKIFKTKFRDTLYHTELYKKVPVTVWKKDFVVNAEPVGKGKSALKYLAQYVYKIAISNKRIINVKKHKVKFRYKESSTGKNKIMTLDVMEFMRRYLQHVLPSGFQKIRYYGFLSSAAKKTFKKIRLLFGIEVNNKSMGKITKKVESDRLIKCPKCGSAMVIKEESRYLKRAPPKLWARFFINCC